MAKTIIQKVKGTRDFYPEQMPFRKWFYGKMQTVSAKYGYQEFDGPELERIELYAEKTSEEIVQEQVFTLRDKDGRMLALRPELTPTFARMVAQRADELTFPLRWQSFGRAWRYEQPQRGRGREFFQWEVNILGPETPDADAEILAMAADFLQSLGLTPDEVVIRVNDRALLESVLQDLGIAGGLAMPVLRIIDRKEKISDQEFATALRNISLTDRQIAGLVTFLAADDYSKSSWLTKLFTALGDYPGASSYVRFDPIIVRGFDYYTRTVFEACDKTGGLKRSLFGGGRFDNLTATLGGKRIPGVGMAPGDMPIEVLLSQFNKIPVLLPQTAKVLVTALTDAEDCQARAVAAELRSAGMSVEVWLEPEVKLGKRLKYAATKGIPYVVIIGPDEAASREAVLRDLSSGGQATVSQSELAGLLTINA